MKKRLFMTWDNGNDVDVIFRILVVKVLTIRYDPRKAQIYIDLRT